MRCIALTAGLGLHARCHDAGRSALHRQQRTRAADAECPSLPLERPAFVVFLSRLQQDCCASRYSRDRGAMSEPPKPPAAGGMIVGQKGVKYGLSVPIKKKPGFAGLVAQRQAARPRAVATAFAPLDDDSEDEDMNAKLARHQEAARRKAAKKIREQEAKAEAEDPTIFDYDAAFDSIAAARDAPKHAERVRRESKYIASLKAKAEERKREEDLRHERRVQREQAAEDHLFGDKEKFVTGAYRKKLEEDKRWLAEQEKRDREEEMEDVTKKKDLGDFYANLGRNVAFGGMAGLREEDKAAAVRREKEREASAGPARAAAPAAPEQRAQAEPPRPAASGGAERPRSASPQARPEPAREGGVAGGAEEGAAAGGERAAPPAAKRTREEREAAARERYLQRKRARQEGGS
ncbi:unnamed protein product [Pedinophyceae sp. YPF-701]|nr:unnamed protein product [Pedinophyceae sp. YPF-701]